MGAVSPKNLRIVVLILLLLVLWGVNKFAQKQVKSVQYWSTLGSIASVNTSTALSVNTGRLPLISFKPLPIGNTPDHYSTTLNDDLFFRAGNMNVVNAKPPEPPKPVINYHELLTKRLTIDSISESGAIINQRFIALKSVIANVEIVSEKGEALTPKLVKIDTDKQLVFIYLNKKIYTLRLR